MTGSSVIAAADALLAAVARASIVQSKRIDQWMQDNGVTLDNVHEHELEYRPLCDGNTFLTLKYGGHFKACMVLSRCITTKGDC